MKFSVLLFLLLALDADARLTSKTVFIGFGLINHEMGRLSGSASGSPTLFGSLYLDLAVTGKFLISPSWYFSPFLSYTPLGSKGADINQKSYLMPFALRLEKRLSQIEIHAGPGVLIYKISGSGGTATLSNGTSTAVFGIPSESRSTTLAMFDLGLGFENPYFQTAIDLYVTGLASSRRALSLALTFSKGVF